MRGLTCTLTFVDGTRLVAKAASPTEEAKVPVEYSGNTTAIRSLPTKESLGFIEWYLRGVATNKGAGIEIAFDGNYEDGVAKTTVYGRAKPKVLIVDDEALMRMLYQKHIEKAGYELLTAQNGEEALTIVKKEKPAIVVLDVILIGPDGLAVLRQLKSQEETRAIPVVIFTATISKEYEATRREAATCGAALFLTKPISPDKLLTEINRLIAPAGSRVA